MDANARIEAASGFLLQSPPGEINDVLNDVRNIISDDDSLQEGVLPALREYNLEQFITVDVPGTEHQSVISEAARIPGSEDGEERWLDPRSKTSFVFNHLTLEATDPQTAELDENAEPLRSALEKSTIAYLAAHFHDGVSSVFSAKDTANKYIIQIVANKYNPSNYWYGPSTWVQLSTTHTISIPLTSAIVTSPPNNAASKILALIETEEGKYQTSLNDTYHEMSEKTFKSLRRALPMTRQKLDWDKACTTHVLGYKLGAELSSSKGNFGAA
ncbi:F-actin-capping protein subunit alpha [Paramarasmius palmivorus]|uniref:F-actin-capping protein subunit alpha n=1 Tax=Paramarasmius palmivorus TaxID=297713 RepID=A0AAW0DZY0_9AGAR